MNERARSLQALASMVEELVRSEGARGALGLFLEDTRRLLDAYGAHLSLCEDDELLVLEVSGLPPGLLEPGEPAIEPSPALEAFRTGKPVWLESREEFLARYPNLESLPTESALALPLREGPDTAVGGTEFHFREDRALTAEERRTLQELVDRLARALRPATGDPARLVKKAEAGLAHGPTALPLHWFQHEVRDLLQSIRVNAETIGLRQPRSEELASRIHESVTAIERLLQLLVRTSGGATLEFAVESLAPQELLSTARGAIQEMARQAGVAIEMEVEEGVPPVRADREWAGHVLRNLLLNAVRHAAEGGQIRIEAKRDGDVVRFTVEDRGPGIPAEHHRQIFLPGWTTGERLGGYGLAICRAIVQSHGGRIWVESEEDRGSQFHFTLLLESARS